MFRFQKTSFMPHIARFRFARLASDFAIAKRGNCLISLVHIHEKIARLFAPFRAIERLVWRFAEPVVRFDDRSFLCWYCYLRYVCCIEFEP
jgi:hypothetical protein